MSTNSIPSSMSKAMRRAGAVVGMAVLGWTAATETAAASGVTLADQPIFATANVPGNMMFTPSVEFPTAISVANLGSYADNVTYLGYFDPAKCYTYQYNAAPEPGSSAVGSSSYFQPTAFATGTNFHTCSGKWSGNFMNWATMQTIDPFRWALTGGYRSVDLQTYPQTILEKAWASNQGGTNNFPYRGTNVPVANNALSSTLISSVTPFSSWSAFNSAIWSNGNMMAFSASSSSYKGTNLAFTLPDLTSVSTANSNPNTAYRVYIRVSVCDTSVLGAPGLESNCVGYGSILPVTGLYSIYKPQGLIQQYSNQIKYSVMGYLNTANEAVQGGVLREPMEFVGPTYPQPLSPVALTNPNAEWSASTGIMSGNPDTTTATNSGVSQSGVMNYLNKFGETGGQGYIAWLAALQSNPAATSPYANNSNIYMTYDHVSELYYAAVRYYENIGNVPQWLPQSSYGASSVQLDGFPAVITWSTNPAPNTAVPDPIPYYCSNNFILGIGDDHTWVDYDVGGSTLGGQSIGGHSPDPTLVAGDTFNQANTWLYALQNLEGITQTPNWPFDAGATYYIAGLAYGTHVTDIRPDLGVKNSTGTKISPISTISTYWLDVAEDQEVENLNPYYLASKYGGFTVPSGYSIGNTTPLTLGEYDTSGKNITMNGGYTHPWPDHYFETGDATAMVASLTSAFQNIAIAITPHTTSFSLSSPIIASTSTLSFASQYSSSNWTSSVTGSTIDVSTSPPTLTQVWSTNTTLQTQLANTGWQAPFNGATGRNVVTWNGTKGVAFEPVTGVNGLTTAQLAALIPGASSYSPSTTATQYLDYLRGDTTNQVGSTASVSTKSLRARTLFLGDIVDAGLTPVGTPSMSYSEANNVGYTAFKSSYATRPTMVYAGANDGMLHGFLGSSGFEQFAYVPSPLFQGPTGTPLVNGLAALGNPNFSHHFYVDATPGAFDLDLNRTNGNTTGSANWQTLLIGGLGKGGTSFYALEVTDPASMTTESAVAPKVLWEFPLAGSGISSVGYSFGTPVVVKTAQWGWVVVLTSGYDGSDTYGHVYIVNPATGALIQDIPTPLPSSGLTQASAYVQDYTDYTADSVYVGDLNGQLWRFDLTTLHGNYPAPTLIATLTDPSGTAQPITSAPVIEIHPTTHQRTVMLGTGQLLSSTDIGSTQTQTFYAIIDGTAGAFSAIATPITRSTLEPVTNLLTAVTIPAGDHGWYFDLPTGYRVLSIPVAYNGIVAFSALIPTTSDPCSPQGFSNVYAINYATGQSVINSTTTGTPSLIAYQSFLNAVTNLRIIENSSGTPELIAGSITGSLSQVNANLSGTLSTRILNWREIPTAE